MPRTSKIGHSISVLSDETESNAKERGPFKPTPEVNPDRRLRSRERLATGVQPLAQKGAQSFVQTQAFPAESSAATHVYRAVEAVGKANGKRKLDPQKQKSF
ncbi:MAG: hypothetical protein ACK4IT_00345 [Thioalkalivibrionaceae bacterium]